MPRTGLASTFSKAAYSTNKVSRVLRNRTFLRIAGSVVLLLCLNSASNAQPQGRQIQFGVDFTTVVPTGDFSKNVTNNGYGVGVQLLFGIKTTPFLVGVDAAFTNYGSEEHTEPISETIPELLVNVRTTNNITMTHLVFRAQPRNGKVRPYADALVGFKYLYTNTSILNESTGEELTSTRNLSDLVSSYGFGGGVQVQLGHLGRTGDISLDTKVRYLRGSEADYLKEGSIQRENGGVFFDNLSSRTDVVTVQVGVTFRW
jgi:hypothetical protein